MTMNDFMQQLWVVFGQIYAGLAWFMPIVAVAAMFFAHRAYRCSARNNAALESMWLLLKAIRHRQEHPAGSPPPDEPSLPTDQSR